MATVEVLSPLTSDHKSLRKAIESLGASSGTPYYDALGRVADEIFSEPPKDDVRGRRAVVALTDGVDSASDSDFAAPNLSWRGPAWPVISFKLTQKILSRTD